MTGDPVTKEMMAWSNLSDFEIANMVRSLRRSDIDHEGVVCAARDRIMYLSQQLELHNVPCKIRGYLAWNENWPNSTWPDDAVLIKPSELYEGHTYTHLMALYDARGIGTA